MTFLAPNLEANLQRYAEFFEPSALDPKRYAKPDSVKTLALMQIKHYQKLALPLSFGKKHQAKTLRTEKAVGEWHELPFLTIKVDRTNDEARVIGHEGRHRTIWMNSHDITLTPVMLWVVREAKTGLGDKMVWGEKYRPKFLRSQNGRLVFPFPQSLVFPVAPQE